MRFAMASKWGVASLVLGFLSLASRFDLGTFLLAQEQPTPLENAAPGESHDKVSSEESGKGKQQTARAKEGTKQAVEARLKAVEHAKPADATGPIHEVEKTLL